jgi:4,5-dihydroxyphthalate decarboxylase
MIIQRARTDTHRAIAVFPKRTFFHQLLMVRTDSPLHGLEELRGARIGLMNWYQHAMGVWLRGHLRERFGIMPEELEWTTERAMSYPLTGPGQPAIKVIQGEPTLVQRLEAGEIDLFVHENARRILAEHPSLRRLIPDHKEAETAYYAATGTVPLNHVLCIRKEIVARDPWVARSLVDAFTTAKEMALGAMERNSAVVSTPWLDSLLEEQRARLARDVFPYGLEPNRPAIERLIRYLHEQALIPDRLPVDEIFANDVQ